MVARWHLATAISSYNKMWLRNALAIYIGYSNCCSYLWISSAQEDDVTKYVMCKWKRFGFQLSVESNQTITPEKKETSTLILVLFLLWCKICWVAYFLIFCGFTALSWKPLIRSKETGFVRVLENLESPGIFYGIFQDWKVLEKKRPLVLESSGKLLNSTKKYEVYGGQ